MSRRTERINELLREEISDVVHRDLNDPRIEGVVSFTEVDVSPDLRHAKVFVSVMGDDETKKDTLRALASARGLLQRELKRRLTIRRVPELTFLADDSIEHGARILELIDKTQEADAG